MTFRSASGPLLALLLTTLAACSSGEDNGDWDSEQTADAVTATDTKSAVTVWIRRSDIVIRVVGDEALRLRAALKVPVVQDLGHLVRIQCGAEACDVVVRGGGAESDDVTRAASTGKLEVHARDRTRVAVYVSWDDSVTTLLPEDFVTRTADAELRILRTERGFRISVEVRSQPSR